jgi:hypothetical protein
MVDLSIPATWRPLREEFFDCNCHFSKSRSLRSPLLAALLDCARPIQRIRAAGLDWEKFSPPGFVSVLQNFQHFCAGWFSAADQDHAPTKYVAIAHLTMVHGIVVVSQTHREVGGSLTRR